MNTTITTTPTTSPTTPLPISKTTTRRIIIIQQYSILKESVNKITPKSHFLPDKDDIDLADFLFLLSYQFMNVKSNEKYAVKIRELLESYSIELDEKEFCLVFPLIKDFVVWFKQLM